jgi:hypothetical protein
MQEFQQMKTWLAVIIGAAAVAIAIYIQGEGLIQSQYVVACEEDDTPLGLATDYARMGKSIPSGERWGVSFRDLYTPNMIQIWNDHCSRIVGRSFPSFAK